MCVGLCVVWCVCVRCVLLPVRQYWVPSSSFRYHRRRRTTLDSVRTPAACAKKKKKKEKKRKKPKRLLCGGDPASSLRPIALPPGRPLAAHPPVGGDGGGGVRAQLYTYSRTRPAAAAAANDGYGNIRGGESERLCRRLGGGYGVYNPSALPPTTPTRTVDTATRPPRARHATDAAAAAAAPYPLVPRRQHLPVRPSIRPVPRPPESLQNTCAPRSRDELARTLIHTHTHTDATHVTLHV